MAFSLVPKGSLNNGHYYFALRGDLLGVVSCCRRSAVIIGLIRAMG